MANDIGNITASLKLESAAFLREMKKAADATAKNTSQMQRSLQSLNKSFASVGNSVKGFIAGFVSVAAIRSFASLAAGAADLADSIGDTAAALQISADALQRYRAAGEQADVSIERMDTALKLFQKSLATGKIHDASFEAFIERIRQAPDEIAKVKIAQEGLSKQFQVGILLAQQSAEEFKKNYDGAATISQQAIDNADTLTKQWTKLEDALSKGFAEGFLESFTGNMKLTTEELEDFKTAAEAVGTLAGKMVQWLGAIGSAFADLGTWISDTTNDLRDYIIKQREANLARMSPEGRAAALSEDALPLRAPTPNIETFGASQGAHGPGGLPTQMAAAQARLAVETENAKKAQDKLNESWAKGTKVIQAEIDPAAQMLSQTFQQMGSMIASAFADAIVEGEELSEVLNQLLKDLAKLAINAVLQHLLSGAIGSAGGGGVLGSLLHSGGTVGYTAQRKMPAGLFAGAPRFHGGLMPDEFPAILQRGERVIPRGMAGAGGGGGVNINVIDKNNNDVKATSREGENGGIDIEIMIDQVAAKKISQPGSAMNRMLNQLGVKQAGIRR